MSMFRVTGGQRGDHTVLLAPGQTLHLEEGERVVADEQLTFDQLRTANLKRLTHFPGHDGTDASGNPLPDDPTRVLGGWTYNDWMVALTGEVGELADLLKKRRRGWVHAEQKGWDREKAGEELADIATYLDLLAACLEIDLGDAVRLKFNQVSERSGLPDRL